MIPIYKTYIPEGINHQLEQILYSGKLSYGVYGKMFEEELKKFIGCEYIITISSYNLAMLIALTTLDLNPNDEVIASPMSCLASNQPFISRRLKVVWADINPDTGTIDPDAVRKKITANTKAIIHNHFCGYIGEIDAINNIGSQYGIPIVDDAIEAFGSRYNNNYIGNVGADITVFSFQTVRLPNTIDGGAIAFKSKDMYEKAILIRDYGIDRTYFRKPNSEINPNCDITLEGFAGTMNEINAFIGLSQMPNIKELLAIQNNNAKIWDKKLLKNNIIRPLLFNKHSEPNYWVYGTQSINKEQTIIDFKENGYYATSVHLPNNYYSVFGKKIFLKGVEEFYNKFVAIPSGWWVKL